MCARALAVGGRGPAVLTSDQERWCHLHTICRYHMNGIEQLSSTHDAATSFIAAWASLVSSVTAFGISPFFTFISIVAPVSRVLMCRWVDPSAIIVAEEAHI